MFSWVGSLTKLGGIADLRTYYRLTIVGSSLESYRSIFYADVLI